MLDNYLERNIQDKVNILNILFDINDIQIQQVALLSDLHPKSIQRLIQELQLEFSNELSLSLKQDVISVKKIEDRPSTYYFHRIYQKSELLNILRFFILNEDDNFNDFIQTKFISIATGYRIRQKCNSLLQSIGLKLQKNKIAGPEYRIRFLIALLQCHFGISIYDFSDGSLELVKQMLAGYSNTLDDQSLETLPERYLFFSTLVALSWKRQRFPLDSFPHKEIDRLKKIFIYPLLTEACHTYLDPHLEKPLQSIDIDYIFLAYCTTHAAFAKDQWDEQKKIETIQVILQDPKVKHLIAKFKKILEPQITKSDAFLLSIAALSRTFLFGLQNLVPFTNHYEHHLKGNQSSLYTISKLVLQEWMLEENIQGYFDRHRLYFFSLYLTEQIRSSLPSVPIHIFLGSQVDINMIKSVMQRNFTEAVATINSYNFLTDVISNSNTLENAIIITTKEYLPYLKSKYASANCHFITISFDLHVNQQQLIKQTIAKLREQAYEEKLATIKAKANHHF